MKLKEKLLKEYQSNPSLNKLISFDDFIYKCKVAVEEEGRATIGAMYDDFNADAMLELDSRNLTRNMLMIVAGIWQRAWSKVQDDIGVPQD